MQLPSKMLCSFQFLLTHISLCFDDQLQIGIDLMRFNLMASKDLNQILSFNKLDAFSGFIYVYIYIYICLL